VTDDPQLTPEELEALRGDLLPDREAMSLLATDPTAYTGGFEDLPSTTPSAESGAGAAGAASGTAAAAPHMIDTDTSDSTTESVTSADRSEQISQSDTATSTT
jgi:hypothetical protein